MSHYAFMTKTRYNEIKDQLCHGVRYSVDGLWVVAKLAEGQTVEHASIETHEKALERVQGPDWTPPDEQGESL